MRARPSALGEAHPFAFFFLDNGPESAKWLPASDRTALLAALHRENSVKEHFSPHGALAALVNPRVLYFSLIYFTIQASVYGVIFYLPTLIADLTGTKVGLRVGVLTAVPWVCAMVTVVVLTRIADRTGRRRWVASAALATAGAGMLVAAATSNPVLGLIGLSLAASGFIAVQPVFWTLPTTFLVGGAAASGIALMNSLGNVGGFVAPSATSARLNSPLILKNFADATFGSGTGLVALAAFAFIGAT